MTITGWSLIRFLHVLAAMCWVGGQLILSLIVLPALRRSSLAPDVRVPLVRAAAKRFGMVANVVLLPTLLATGLALAAHRHLSWEILGNPGYGRLFSIKMVLVVTAVALAAIHGIVASRRPTSARPLAIASLVASVSIVVFATALVP
ncbi:MAG TPA: hypothetical protein VIR58_06880 [Acidimicrobiales bacterium]